MKTNKIILLSSVIVIVLILFTCIFLAMQNASKKKTAFENKAKCEKYMEQAKEQTVEDFYLINSLAGNSSSVAQIFYSPIENTCLYTVELAGKDGIPFTIYIKDVLTHQTIKMFTTYNEDFIGSPSRYKIFLSDRDAWN